MTAAARVQSADSAPRRAHQPRRAAASLDGYLAECRAAVLEELRRIIPSADARYGRILYQLILDYPLREAKGLRPTLAIATCRALGGSLQRVLPTAAILELFHNAFLVHDDVEDESIMRRGRPTLHRDHGVPIAVNVGDAMLCLVLEPLLENTAIVGLGPALRILDAIARMTRETVEGQSIELDWVRQSDWAVSEADYVRMVVQKTGWYSFMTPVRVGAIVAGLDSERTEQLVAFARDLSVAFQIQDDVLNLQADVQEYGKEIGGDLWEGKRTLILLHMMKKARPRDRREAERILALPRPAQGPEGVDRHALLEGLVASGDLTARGLRRLRRAGLVADVARPAKTVAEVRWLQELIRRHDSLAYASGVARRWTEAAQAKLDGICRWLPPSAHRDVLAQLVTYVQARTR
jgi:geranylgeranyl diphosphate synthase type II